MVGPPTSDALVELVRKSGLVEQDRLDAYLGRRRALGALPSEPSELATVLIRDGFLTNFQAEELLKGNHSGFTISRYRILERLGSGRNSSVFLCEHLSMRRKVALKTLPLAKAEDPSSLARFYREARAAGTLDHPNIVRTYDNGQEGDLHFLVMEYVDGCNLEGIVQKYGPMAISRAAAYIRQAASGLQYIHQAGLIHRDIKPANLLLDRRGIVKILDLGLVRFFHDQKDRLTQQYDPTSILGTADYLSPEQALSSHDVDIRTDIYSLGATFYFLLAGQPPFQGKSFSQKLLSHLTKDPDPLRGLRPEVPEGLAAVVEKMMAKDREQRYPNAAAIVQALAPWTETAIEPPPAQEMAQLSPAAQNAGSAVSGSVPAATAEKPSRVVRVRQEQETCAAHAAFAGQGTYGEVPAARAVAAGPATAELPNPARFELPRSSPHLSISPPPAQPPLEVGDDAFEQQRSADTELISEIDTGLDSRQGLPRDPDSGQSAPVKLTAGRRGQLAKRVAFCLVAASVLGGAVVGGVALAKLSPKPQASARPGQVSPQSSRSFSAGQKSIP